MSTLEFKAETEKWQENSCKKLIKEIFSNKQSYCRLCIYNKFEALTGKGVEHEYNESENGDYKYSYCQTAYNGWRIGTGVGCFYPHDSVWYSGFVSTIPDIHEDGRKRRGFYKGGLQTIYQFAYVDRAGNSVWNVWADKGGSQEGFVTDYSEVRSW